MKVGAIFEAIQENSCLLVTTAKLADARIANNSEDLFPI